MQPIHVFKVAILLSALFSVTLALFVVCKKNKTPPLYYFSALMLSVAFYGTFYFFELTMTDLKSALLCLNLEYLGLVFIPFLWFSLAWCYQVEDTKSASRFKKYEPLFFLIPLLMIILKWTNPLHGLIYKSFSLQPDSPFTILNMEKGIFYYPFNLILAFIALAGTIKMMVNAFKMKGCFRGQFLLMTTAALLPTVGHFVNIFLTFSYHLDLGPIFFALAGFFFFWGIIKIQLLDLTPIEKSLMLNALEDGVLVVDVKNRIVEYNEAAIKSFLNNDTLCQGKSLKEVNNQLYKILNEIEGTSDVIYQDEKGSTSILKITRSYINHKVYGRRGSLFILRDVTELRSYVQKLEYFASKDPLTGLPNRRQFLIGAAKELSLAERKNTPFSLILLDIDHFKIVNDTYGHSAGDEVLKEVSNIMQKKMRCDSIYARFGGEEFVILLPDTTTDQAMIVIERLRSVIEENPIESDGHLIKITASFGISIFQPQTGMTLDTCLKQADMAMYRAKEKGRNCVCQFR